MRQYKPDYSHDFYLTGLCVFSYFSYNLLKNKLIPAQSKTHSDVRAIHPAVADTFVSLFQFIQK